MVLIGYYSNDAINIFYKRAVGLKKVNYFKNTRLLIKKKVP